jgi:transcriptional regulator with PAS, ATPase and Fis domain
VVVVDADNRIVYLNQNYADILGITTGNAIGRDAREVIPGSLMHRVLETGREEIGSAFVTKRDETIIVNRIPIRKDGKIIGAFAFSALSKVENLTTVSTIDQIHRLNWEISQYKQELGRLRGAKYSLDQIIGKSAAMQTLRDLIRKVASTKSTILITGETGTGKELVAHAVHQESPRSHQSFIRLNCAAIPRDLMESEFFGYEDGAFTGGKRGGKPGKFEMADNGSLFLDEIDQLHPDLQSKLLRVLQEQEFERVGGVKTIRTDVRFICASNEDLIDLVNRGEFRRDLYYRINVVNIYIPPLREHLDDIPLLVEHCISKINRKGGFAVKRLGEGVLELFMSYDWPGNVRELEHVLEGAANLELSGTLDMKVIETLMPHLSRIKDTPPYFQNSLKDQKAKIEKDLIIDILKKTRGNKSRASRLLKLDRSVLYDKLRKYGIHT